MICKLNGLSSNKKQIKNPRAVWFHSSSLWSNCNVKLAFLFQGEIKFALPSPCFSFREYLIAQFTKNNFLSPFFVLYPDVHTICWDHFFWLSSSKPCCNCACAPHGTQRSKINHHLISTFVINVAYNTWQTKCALWGVWHSHCLAVWVVENILFIILNGMRRALKLLIGAAVNPQSP